MTLDLKRLLSAVDIAFSSTHIFEIEVSTAILASGSVDMAENHFTGKLSVIYAIDVKM